MSMPFLFFLIVNFQPNSLSGNLQVSTYPCIIRTSAMESTNRFFWVVPGGKNGRLTRTGCACSAVMAEGVPTTRNGSLDLGCHAQRQCSLPSGGREWWRITASQQSKCSSSPAPLPRGLGGQKWSSKEFVQQENPEHTRFFHQPRTGTVSSWCLLPTKLHPLGTWYFHSQCGTTFDVK